ncbi:dnaJ homolog subfamily C member 12 [Gadus morhua]|uniref:dnaJ homolog subfamily C member 12 n=1 Tax=Gadus morhua TaxID=8049 RepID=UPI0011B54858|nr:dnaJ homolog subfamily C member 12 [Gadus morhua]
MEAVLNSKREDFEDYYGLLGCDELSSTEQISNEYKIRALTCHPDKQPENPKAVADFQKLQEAKEVLCDESKRKNYDLWTRSGVTISFHDWQALKDSVKTSMHWAVRAKKEPMLEEAKSEFAMNSQAEEIPVEQNASEEDSHEPVSSFGVHHRFRWASDSPSTLLQKFRNYEI